MAAESIIVSRHAQAFPTLAPEEIERLRRFGELKSYDAGSRLVTAGEVSPGMFVVLRGQVEVTHRSVLGPDEHIVTHGPGSFMGRG